MIEIIKSDVSKLSDILKLRSEMLKVVNGLDQAPNGMMMDISAEYFTSGDQTTVLAYDGETAIGCASICYITLMPTYSHPTGRRAHIMNVYTCESHRRQGIARRMMTMLLDEARERRVTHVTLDATESGRPLYLSLGFEPSEDSMGMILS